MNFGVRLQTARKAKGYTQEQLAQMIGVAKSTLTGYEKGNREPDFFKIKKMIEALDVTSNYLLGIDEDTEDPTPTPWHKPLDDAYERADVPRREVACDVLRIPYVTPGKPAQAAQPPAKPIPDNVVPFEPRMISKLVYDDGAAAGEPIAAESDYQHLEFSEGEVPYNADFGIRIKGMSMAPDIEDGDLVWVHKQYTVPDNQVGVFMIDGEAVCKRAITNHRGELIRLQSDNDEFPDIEMRDLDEYAEVRPVGRVVGTCKATDVPKQ